ncbi:MAG TPA: hypothetical protein DCQ04_07945 [Actinobacteria bacterium]|nr:hypothetical protein [Actinomycetota bacterium]
MAAVVFGAATLIKSFVDDGASTAARKVTLADEPMIRITATPGTGCSETGTWLASWAVPELTGTLHDEEFNSYSHSAINQMLADDGYDGEWIEFDGPSGIPESKCTTGNFNNTGVPALNYVYAKADVTLVSDRFVSLIFRSGSWGEVSHEYGTSKGLVFDVTTGTALEVGDVLDATSGWQQPVVVAICKDLPYCQADPSMLMEDGRFAISSTGVTFLFADCELESCATGPNEININWSALKDHLTDEFESHLGL